MNHAVVLLLVIMAGCSQPKADPTSPTSNRADAATEIAKLLENLPVGTPAEYDRIPAIWEHAIAAGKRNDTAELRRVLEQSLSKPGEPLADWQAVVLGGGVINGLSQVDVWPQRRLTELMAERPDLQSRWQRSVELAVAMANNDAVRTGTRYDALRILGAEDYQRHGAELVRFLAPGVDDELHMGAVSGLSDMEAPEATAAIVEAFPKLNDHNRSLAFEAMLRTPLRKAALIKAIQGGSIAADQLTAEQAAQVEMP